MSNKRRRDKCKFHVIGQYYYLLEIVNFCIKSDIPKESEGIIYYSYCPLCGEKITEKIKTSQMSDESVGKFYRKRIKKKSERK